MNSLQITVKLLQKSTLARFELGAGPVDRAVHNVSITEKDRIVNTRDGNDRLPADYTCEEALGAL